MYSSVHEHFHRRQTTKLCAHKINAINQLPYDFMDSLHQINKQTNNK